MITHYTALLGSLLTNVENPRYCNNTWNVVTRCQLHQHFTNRYCASRFTMIWSIIIEHKSWAWLLAVCTGKNGHSFVGETNYAKLCLPISWWNWAMALIFWQYCVTARVLFSWPKLLKCWSLCKTNFHFSFQNIEPKTIDLSGVLRSVLGQKIIITGLGVNPIKEIQS